jgi:hypothetical protein
VDVRLISREALIFLRGLNGRFGSRSCLLNRVGLLRLLGLL